MYAIALDMGGTFLKSAIVNSKGSILDGSFTKTSSLSNSSKELIMKNILNILEMQIKRAKDINVKIEGIGIGIPGPADYEKGILYIPPQLNKYYSLYGISLKDEILKQIDFTNIQFELDSFLFLRGENWVGAAKNFNRVIGITLGTGLGSALMVNGEIVVDEKIIPPQGWIGGLKYGKGIVEDIISARWISHQYKKLKNSDINLEVEEIARLARQGDKISLMIFEELGKNLSMVLKPIVLKFKPECIIFGGQISKSFNLFESSLKKDLNQLPFSIEIKPAKFIELSPLYGAAYLIFSTY